ncbi:hypothetical protein Leryth_025914 [Lithospermum erythrorhizon]|nr:hypothetical protein Leryth_025914 [Lithospermum erythrorhizon]
MLYIIDDGLSTLENLYGKPITLADREFVEEKSDDMLSEAASSDVAFLVVGDPFGATTHTDLLVRAKKYTSEGTNIGILVQGERQYEPPRYMTIRTVIEQILEVEQTRGEHAYGEDTTCMGLARLGSEDQKVVSGPMKQLLVVDIKPPLHCIVIVGNTHPLEEMLEFYTLTK